MHKKAKLNLLLFPLDTSTASKNLFWHHGTALVSAIYTSTPKLKKNFKRKLGYISNLNRKQKDLVQLLNLCKKKREKEI